MTAACTGVEVDLGDLLEEFEAVVEELSAPSAKTHGSYEPLLRVMNRRSAPSDSVTDSGIEDTDGSEPSAGNSLNVSTEELNTAGATAARKAKLGDTSDLESFIENLDKELADM